MALGPDTDTLLRSMNAKLEGIYLLLKVQTRPLVEAEVAKVASTKERRKAWILSDGQRKTEEIARLSGAALRTIQIFVQEAERLELMDTGKRGYPKRRLDVIPATWDSERQEIELAIAPPEPGTT